MHPWHDVSPGPHPEEVFFAVIEIPSGAQTKYELDKETGLLRLDRVLSSSVHYVANYGLIPRTCGNDGEPLNVFVLSQEAFVPKSLVRARPVGLVATVDDRGKDDKIISVAADDPGYDQVHTVTDLPPHRFREMEQFLKGYKALQDTVLEVGAPQGVRKARMAIRDALRLYDVQLRPGLQGRHKGWLLNHKPK